MLLFSLFIFVSSLDFSIFCGGTDCVFFLPAAQVTFNASLYHCSVPTNTVLSSSSVFLTFFLSLFVLRDPFKLSALFAISFCFGGVALIAFHQPLPSTDGQVDDSLVGYILCLTSALFYAIFVVLLKRSLPSEEQIDMSYFFG